MAKNTAAPFTLILMNAVFMVSSFLLPRYRELLRTRNVELQLSIAPGM